jgi:tetratricopeptide (TPR) repeat protein
MLLGERRAAEAASVLDAGEATPPVLVRRIRAAIAESRLPRAQASFVELLGAEKADDDAKRRGRDVFVEAAATEELREAFEQALAAPSPPDAAAALHVEWLGSHRDWRGCDALVARLPAARPALRRAALAGYVRGLRGAGEARRLKRLAKRERATLHADDFLWGLTGHALSLADDRAAAEWMRDWPRRATSPWALGNLAISLRRLHRREEALRVSRRALELAPDTVTPCHRAWVAIEAAIDGDLGEAESLLERLEPPEESKAFYAAIARLARAAIAARRSGRAAYDEARRLIREADGLAGRNNRDSLPLRRRVVDVVVRAHGGARAWLWRFLDTG